jgi:hypothetical protein
MSDMQFDTYRDNLINSLKPDNIRQVSEFARVYNLLVSGKKVRISKRVYMEAEVPTIVLKGDNGTVQEIELDCLNNHDFCRFPVNNNHYISEVEIVSYRKAEPHAIKYIYLAQGSRLMAVLDNGKETECTLNLMDICSMCGEYIEPRKVIVQYWDRKSNGDMKLVDTCSESFSNQFTVEDIIEHFKTQEVLHIDSDILVTFEDMKDDAVWIKAEDRVLPMGG